MLAKLQPVTSLCWSDHLCCSTFLGAHMLQECTGVEMFPEGVGFGASTGSVTTTAVVWGGSQPQLG